MASRWGEPSAVRNDLLAELSAVGQLSPWTRRVRLFPAALALADVAIAGLLLKAGFDALALGWLVASAPLYLWSARSLSLDPARCAPLRIGQPSGALALGAGVARGLLLAVLFQFPPFSHLHSHHYAVTGIFLVVAVAFALACRWVVPVGFLVWSLPVALALAAGWAGHGLMEGACIAAFIVVAAALLGSHMRERRVVLDRMLSVLQHRDQLARSLRAERDRAAASSASKTRFFAAASHDLRQPLHALSINASTLHLVAGRQADPVIRDLSESINRALQRSNGLLDSLLDLSRLDANAVDVRIEPVSALALLLAASDEFRPSAAQRGVELSVDVPGDGSVLWMATDATLMLRVISNLVSNAIKFTDHGVVSVRARPDVTHHAANEAANEAKPRQQFVVLEVADTGCGISASEQTRVFDEFYQVGNPQRDAGAGLGLGLSIVKRATELLNVRLHIESAIGKGTSITLHIPATTAPPSISEVAPAERPAPDLQCSDEPVRVLLIEDEKEIRDSLAEFMPYLGHELRNAANSEEALAVLSTGYVPTVLVVDHLLQDETGLLAVHRLRRLLGSIPVVMVTGDTDPMTVELATESGLLVVHKPLDGMQLMRILREAQATAIA